MSVSSSKGEVRRHLVEADGKEGGLHLLEERAAQSMNGAFVTKNANVDLRMIRRDEEGKSLDVVPVGVADENQDVQSRGRYLLHERLPQPANAGAGVHDDDLIADANLDARCVSAVDGSVRARCGDGTADAPEPDQGWPGDDAFRCRLDGGRFAVVAASGHRANQVGRRDGLDEIIVRAGRERCFAVVRETADRRQNHASRLERGLLANPAANLEAVAFRRAQIADHGSGFVFQDEIEAGLSVRGFEDAPLLSGEALRDERASQRIAVDQDERFHFVAASVGSMIQKELPPSLRDS